MKYYIRKTLDGHHMWARFGYWSETFLDAQDFTEEEVEYRIETYLSIYHYASRDMLHIFAEDDPMVYILRVLDT